MIGGILLSTILTLTPVWSSKEVFFVWESMGQGYEYIFETYTDVELKNLYFTLPPTTNRYVYATYFDTGLYFQRVKYYHTDTPQDYSYTFLGQKYINMEEGYVSEAPPFTYYEEEVEYDIEEDIPSNTDISEDIEEEVLPEIDLGQDIPRDIKQLSYSLSKDIDYREKILSKNVLTTLNDAIKGGNKVCNISILKGDTTKVKSWDCDIDVKIGKVKYLDWMKYKSLEIQGTYPESIDVNIRVYECRKFKLTDIGTWTDCKEVLIDTYKGKIDLFYSGSISVNGVRKDSESLDFGNSNFVIRNVFKEDISKKSVKLNLVIYSQFKNRVWSNFLFTIKRDVPIPDIKSGFQSKPFAFPLDRIIGVTQWHGCTVYQCPHKGIDFGARLNRVVSIGDGEVVNLGYDKYGGECNQGGKFLVVKHTNGLYSAYIHLDSYLVKKKQKLKRGDLIGISGNTGRKNCQPLKYHLHFEVRKGPLSSTHLNPVNYVDVDWASIPTLGYKQSPGRLGGDNPHPGY